MSHRLEALFLGAMSVLVATSTSSAQVPPAPLRLPIVEGECQIVVALPGWKGTLLIDGQPATPAATLSTGPETTILLQAPVRADERIEVTGAVPARVKKAVEDKPSAKDDGAAREWPSCVPSPKRTLDQRPAFAASFGVGFLSETFAPKKAELQALFAGRQDSQGQTTFTRRDAIATQFDMSYRLPIKGLERRPVSFLARTFYGRRTGVCAGEAPDGQASNCTGIPEPGQALVIVRRADTSEVYFGGRWEVLPLFQSLPDQSFPGSVYVTCVVGAVFIEGVGDKALSNHFCGGGFTLVGGQYQNTYVEIGAGKSEIFAPDRSNWNRKKADVFVTARVVNRNIQNGVGRFMNSFHPFFRYTLDRGKGPDASTTNFGFVWDFVRVFGSPF